MINENLKIKDMKTNYEAPQIEVIEIEIEGVLCQSGPEDGNQGNNLGGFLR